MDVASLILSIPGLIVLIVNGYKEIQAAVESYRNLDDDLVKILERIECEQKMFGVFVERLLAGIIDEDRRQSLKRGQGADDYALQQDVASGLGDLAGPVKEYMKHAHNTIKEISNILTSELNPPPSKPATAHRASSVQFLAFRALDLTIKSKAGSSITKRHFSVRNKLKIMSKGTYKKLQKSHEELEKHNMRLDRCLNAKNARVGSRNFPEVAPATSMIVQGNKEAAVRHVTTTTPHGQTLSTMLYWALSNVPPCDCHLLHLDLECCGSDKGFSLLVKSNIGDTRLTSCVPGIEMQLTQANDLVLEVVTSNTGTVCASDASHSLCQMLFAAQQDQANYLLGNFVVKNIHRPQPCAPAHCGSITLHDMIHKKGVTTYDRMIWATKLSNAALSFYSSPWIKGWTTRTIKFFAEYEQSPEPASWKPHISTTSGSSAPYFPDNIEVYSLGVMLLEIGGFDIEEFKKKPQPEVLQEAFGAIMRQMGRQYKQVAQRCFMAYQQSQVQGESPEDCVAVLSQEVTKLQKEIDACFSF